MIPPMQNKPTLRRTLSRMFTGSCLAAIAIIGWLVLSVYSFSLKDEAQPAGAAVGRSLAFALDCAAVAVHHMEGHLLAPLLEADPPEFPFVALLVSGGHSMLVRVAELGCYQVLGDTLDDAAGEAGT